ncbi:MAG: DUF2214 domain-containing protein [Rhizobiales bacterium]|nr:DUF2214 domain-containing protein [Hyphomicrobiales bacterium]
MRIVEWIGAWPGAVLLRDSGTAYLFVNAAHILGIALLIGAILPLDLRLMGCFRTIPLAVIAPFLSRVAAVGIAFAVLTGLCLFSVKPSEYLANTAFLWKIALLAAALGNVALQHHSRQYWLALEGGGIPLPVRIRAAVSALMWLSVLVAGRWIGFL